MILAHRIRFLTPVVIVVAVLFSGCNTAPQTPGNYVRFDAPNKRFSIEYPENWDASGGESRGMQWIDISSGSVKCSIKTNAMTAAMGDLGQLGSGGGAQRLGEVDDDLQPEAMAHAMLQKIIEVEMPGYEEEPATTFRTNIGRIRMANFTAKGVAGMRGTMILGGDTVSFLFQGPTVHSNTMAPVFEHMLKSVGKYGMQ